MKVITRGKIITGGQNYSGVDADTKKALIGSGVAAGGALVASLAARAGAGKQGLAADVQTACGRKPLFGKDKKAKYQECVNNFTQSAKSAPQQGANTPKAPQAKKMSDTVKYSLIGGGVLVLLIGVYFITKKK